MHTARTSEPPADEQPTAPVRGEEEEGFAALYERWFEPLYDFAARTLRDREAAAEVVRASFAKAFDSLRRGRTVVVEEAWLYAVARRKALERARRRRPRPSGRADEAFVQLDHSRLVHPRAVASDRELVELVWRAAAALEPADYSLLDLHLRQELTAHEMAQVLDVRKGAVYPRLSRLRDSLDEEVVLTLMLRRATRDCAELAALVGDRRRLTADLRDPMRGHVEACDRCRPASRRMPSPVEVFGALDSVPPLPGVREALWTSLSATAHVQRPRFAWREWLRAEGDTPTTAWRAAGATAVAPGAGGAAVTSEAGAATVTSEAGAAAVASGAGAVASWRRAPLGARIGAGALAALLGLGGVAGAIELVSRDSGPPAPRDPAAIHSTSHAVNVPDRDRVIRMSWRREPGATAYAVVFSRDRRALPAARRDLPGGATSASSDRLSPGRWWFVLRTRGADGDWTSTARRGPYPIVAPKPKPRRRKRAKKEEPAPVAVEPVPVVPPPVLEPPVEPEPKRPARRRRPAQRRQPEPPKPPPAEPKPEPLSEPPVPPEPPPPPIPPPSTTPAPPPLPPQPPPPPPDP